MTKKAAQPRALKTITPARRKGRPVTIDQAWIAVLLAAMDANQHVSAEEAARAHHIIWSMRRFRSRPGEEVDRLVGSVRERMEADGVDPVLDESARVIPARMRPAAFAVAIDLMLADTKLERQERQFVTRLAQALNVPGPVADDILRVMLVKNSA